MSPRAFAKSVEVAIVFVGRVRENHTHGVMRGGWFLTRNKTVIRGLRA